MDYEPYVAILKSRGQIRSRVKIWVVMRNGFCISKIIERRSIGEGTSQAIEDYLNREVDKFEAAWENPTEWDPSRPTFKGAAAGYWMQKLTNEFLQDRTDTQAYHMAYQLASDNGRMKQFAAALEGKPMPWDTAVLEDN